MQDYTFEYTRQGFAYLLFALSFAIVVFGVSLCCILFKDIIPLGIAVIVLIGSGIAFFLLNKHQIKRTGIAKLSINGLTIEQDQVINIPFSDLKYYYIYDGKNGIVFTLGFGDATKFKVEANKSFCNDKLLKEFLSDFQLAIDSYNAQNKANIIHLETIFARKRTLFVLSIITVLVILGFCFTSMPLTLLPIGVSMSILLAWIRYFQQRSKNKLVDF
ncbi:hypothetical protein DIU31_021870 [Mucilaginibacter rubeus]|uniref:Uncharacterized protein n=1 Tax=Mucilaginibacter rubeus TaxID=2027860 RepID=A0AAE6JHY4_9SPHI|nr:MULTISPECIES: hypothetical protein [Mucilaginibacter]QEM06027.1 hypothetical protein DIU31_021870 [Mucilaginibacter rubeus]QEM18608.1 hypothetical protein DIU38_022095 [Mucilaginibacter gossypii]QTE44850.1 hypothetical protein J3L19_05620 [Mucilaginibacter rubeus]QTE51448.1 hypothetical protein J3L21_05595 [Mucilaginibacter rubeus]QTE56534.1 hypothetical protein J3L23_30840 [Mucilaginibacter rubeus]